MWLIEVQRGICVYKGQRLGKGTPIECIEHAYANQRDFIDGCWERIVGVGCMEGEDR